MKSTHQEEEQLPYEETLELKLFNALKATHIPMDGLTMTLYMRSERSGAGERWHGLYRDLPMTGIRTPLCDPYLPGRGQWPCSSFIQALD